MEYYYIKWNDDEGDLTEILKVKDNASALDLVSALVGETDDPSYIHADVRVYKPKYPSGQELACWMIYSSGGRSEWHMESAMLAYPIDEADALDMLNPESESYIHKKA